MARPRPYSVDIDANASAAERLLHMLERRQDEVAELVTRGVCSEVEAYRLVAGPEFRAQVFAQVREHVCSLVRAARSGRLPTGQDLEFVREVGMQRANELSPLDALLYGYHVGQRIIFEWLSREAGSKPEELRAALDLTARMFDYSNLVNTTLAEAYVIQSQQLAADADRLKRDLLEDLLSGRLGLRDEAGTRAAALGLSPTGEYCVALATIGAAPTPASPEQLRRVSEALARRFVPQVNAPFVVARSDEVVALVSATAPEAGREQIRHAVEALSRTHRLQVAVGISTPCRGFADVPRGYDEARRAMRQAACNGGVVALLDIPPLEYLVANADRVAYQLAQHWAGRLVAEDAHQHGVLLETLEAYFAAELNVQRTAERLNVHANTVQNRLRRVGVLTGRQMRRLHDLVQVLTAVRLLRSMD